MDQIIKQPGQHDPEQKKAPKLWRFLKPDIRKMGFFVILAFPIVYTIFTMFSGYRTDITALDAYVTFFQVLWVHLFDILLYLFSGAKKYALEPLILQLSFAIALIFAWVVAAALGNLWKAIFRFFGKRSLVVEVTVAVILLGLVAWFVFIAPPLSRDDLKIEETFRDVVPFAEIEKGRGPFWVYRIVVHNDSAYSLKYELPRKVACLHDQETGSIISPGQGWRIYPGDGNKDILDYTQIKAGKEQGFEYAVYLSVSSDLVLKPPVASPNNLYYDAILLFDGPEQDTYSYVDFCQNIQKEDIPRAHQIDIDFVYKNAE